VTWAALGAAAGVVSGVALGCLLAGQTLEAVASKAELASLIQPVYAAITSRPSELTHAS